MVNFSYRVDNNKSFRKMMYCVNGEILELRNSYAKGITRPFIELHTHRRLSLEVREHFHVSIPNELFTLKFVSCGRPSISPLAFKELINVFDVPIWICIVARIMTCHTFKTCLVDTCTQETRYDVKFTSKTLFDIFRPLLSQGDAFSNDTRWNSWKLILILYLLAAIVLTNGYQNTNVYNMVKPRLPVPYERFSQLIEDGFTVYTRTLTNSRSLQTIFTENGISIDSKENSTLHEIRFLSKHSAYGLASEVLWLSLPFHYSKHKNTKDMRRINRLIEYSRLLPNLLHLFNKTGLDYIKRRKLVELDFPDLVEMIPFPFRENEQDMLEETLQICSKVALLLPENIAAGLALKLKCT